MSSAVEPLTLSRGEHKTPIEIHQELPKFTENLDFPQQFLFLTFTTFLSLCFFFIPSRCVIVMLSMIFIVKFSDIARAIELLEKLQMSGEVPATKLSALQKVLQVSKEKNYYEKFLRFMITSGFLHTQLSFSVRLSQRCA